MTCLIPTPCNAYISTTLRCNKCQRIGHAKNWCRRADENCARCTQVGHKLTNCQKLSKNAHSSINRKWPAYEYKAEILATKIRNGITYPEAEEKVKERFRNYGKTYSFVV